MPKRPAAKLMPRKKIIKVKSETGSGAKLPGKNRFKNQETRRRQKAKWEKIKETAKEERAQPAPAFEIPARGGDVPVRRFFDPISGERQWKSSQSTGSRSFELRNQVFPGTLLRIVLATSVVRGGT